MSMSSSAKSIFLHQSFEVTTRILKGLCLLEFRVRHFGVEVVHFFDNVVQ